MDNVQKWWSTDFCTHPFCSLFAALLDQSRATLSMCLPHLKSLVLTAPTVESDTKNLAIFKLVQIFSRLQLSYEHWTRNRNNPMESKAFILEGFRFTSGTSSMAARQIKWFSEQKTLKSLENIQDSKKKKFSKNFRSTNYNKNNPQNHNQRSTVKTTHPKSRPQMINKVKCYNCGRLGHTARACRLNRPKPNNYNNHNNIPPPPQNK